MKNLFLSADRLSAFFCLIGLAKCAEIMYTIYKHEPGSGNRLFKEEMHMKTFAKILLVVGVIAAVCAAVGFCTTIFETKMTKYYKVY